MKFRSGNYEKSVLLVSMILTLALVGAIGCSSNDKASPEDVVRDFLDVSQSNDVAKMASYCTEDYFRIINFVNLEEQIAGEPVNLSNLETELIDQNEDSAEVYTTYDVEFLISEESTEQFVLEQTFI